MILVADSGLIPPAPEEMDEDRREMEKQVQKSVEANAAKEDAAASQMKSFQSPAGGSQGVLALFHKARVCHGTEGEEEVGR